MLRAIINESEMPPEMEYSGALPLSNEALITSWFRWEKNAVPGSGEYRDQALQRLRVCLESSHEILDLSSLNLTYLPDHFPPSITKLYANRNRLIELPKNLPEQLTVINVNGNRLTQLPQRLPPNLIKLKVKENQLTVLPNRWPEMLKTLIISENNLFIFPTNLPPNLERLYISFNRHTLVPTHLPSALIKFEMRGHRLEVLPNLLPETLEELDVVENQLTSLPESLPPFLKRLFVSHNQLKQLPNSLPTTLKILYVNNNCIEELPRPLPLFLREVDISRNPLIRLPEVFPYMLSNLFISQNHVSLLPENLPGTITVRNVDAFSLQSNVVNSSMDIIQNEADTSFLQDPISYDSYSSDDVISIDESLNLTLRDQLEYWSTQFDILTWEKIQFEENAQVFGDFLGKLHFGENKRSSSLRNIIIEWINYLAQEENSALRKQTFLIAQEVTGNCVDRASFYFNKMNLLRIEYDFLKMNTPFPLKDVVKIIVSMYRLTILERIAAEHIAAIKQDDSDLDEIEIYFSYQYQLRKVLQLPIPTKLQFSYIANLDKETLISAERRVLEHEKQQFLRYLVTESSLWIQVLQRWNKSRYDNVNAAYLDYLESPHFQQAINRELSQHNLSIRDEDIRRQIEKTLADELLFEKRFQLTNDFLYEQNNITLLDSWR